LSNSLGQGISSHSEAEAARRIFMAHLMIGQEIESRKEFGFDTRDMESFRDAASAVAHPSGISLQEAWGAFVRSQNRRDVAASTLEQQSFQWSGFLEFLAHRFPAVSSLDGVSAEMADAFLSDLSRRVSPATWNKYLGLVGGVWSALGVRPSPWSGIRRRVADLDMGRRELTRVEMERLLELAAGEWRTLFLLGIYTGMRLGDCATLRQSEVDLLRGVIVRIPMKTARRRSRPVVVPVHVALRPVLEEALGARGAFVLPVLAKLYERDKTSVSRPIQALFRKANIQTTVPGPRGRARVLAGFHSLRYSFVSLCREAGAPMAVVEALVGHASPAMTRHYTRIGDLAAASAVALLPMVGIGKPVSKVKGRKAVGRGRGKG
jgi:integrase